MPLTTPPANPLILPGQRELVFGFNADVDSATVPEDIWPLGAQIPFPDVADVVSIVSTSAADTVAGTGARVLLLIGVGSDLNIITELVPMNGLTPVLSTKEFLFVNRSAVAAAGSTEGNEGLITYTIGADTCNAMPILGGQTQTAAIVIPNAINKNTQCNLLHVYSAVGKTPNVLATISLVVGRNGVNIRTLDNPISSDSGPLNISLKVPLIALPGDRIRVLITDVSGNNVLASAFVQLAWLPIQ